VDGNRRIELILAGYIGDRIVVVVQKQRAAGSEGTSTSLANKVRRGDIRHAVVVRVKKELQREDGTVVRFGDNACVLVNKSGDPIGTRMNGQWFLWFWFLTTPESIDTDISTGVVGQELRGKQWSKILSLAPVHV
jgi:ribosomal protein L14